jgi:hypothetical protein
MNSNDLYTNAHRLLAEAHTALLHAATAVAALNDEGKHLHVEAVSAALDNAFDLFEDTVCAGDPAAIDEDAEPIDWVRDAASREDFLARKYGAAA